MHFRSASTFVTRARLSASHALLLGVLLLISLWAIFAWTQPTYATEVATELTPEPAATSARPSSTGERAFGTYILLLQDEPVALFHATQVAAAQAQPASITALTQAHLATVEEAQAQIAATLASHDAQVLYRVQRVLNGIAVYAPADQVTALAALPGVQGVYPLIPKEPSNSRTAKLLGVPRIWQEMDRAGLTGRGVRIAIIDTGIDYLHTMFGGSGDTSLANDTTIIGDVPDFPGIKIIGGYDFAGDDYNATADASNYQPVPQPDPDPMDCYGFGHGTHVAGTAAGYGVAADGATYAGLYDTTINTTTMRIGPGMAPEATIYALKVFGCSGSSNVVNAAIEWAVDPNQDGDFSDRVDVVNLSLGSNFGVEYDVTTLAVENAAKLGVIVVASAGNTGDVHYAVGSPGIATQAIAVAATSIDSTNPDHFEDDGIAPFSARGPRRGDHILKPDLAAPGMNIVSAQRDTGNQSVISSGTSMASPVVAGTMALLRQARPESGIPGWRNDELKALVMNTATYPVVEPESGTAYSLARIGAGRIDPLAALQSHLIAFDAAAPAQVSVSFGLVEVLETTNRVRAVRLHNKSGAPISVTVGYTSVRDLPGVTVDVAAGQLITVPAFGFATTAVTLSVDAAALVRQSDSTRQIQPAGSYPWADEIGGYLTFTPVIPASGPAIHLPIHAQPRVVSALNAIVPPIDMGDAASVTVPLTITGSALTTAIAPTQTVPLMGIFALTHSSPPISKLPSGEPTLGRYMQADLRYIGVAGPTMVNGERMLYFALVSHGEWSTPLEVIYQIAIDVNGDKFTDFRLQNREATDVSVVDFGATDDFVSLLEKIGGARTIQAPLNLYSPSEFDARPFANSVMVLALRLDELGKDISAFDYQVTSASRDIINTQASQTIDTTPILTFALRDGVGVTTDTRLPLFPVYPDAKINLTLRRAALISQQSEELLLVYLHNEMAARTQTVPVLYDAPDNQYLPSISATRIKDEG